MAGYGSGKEENQTDDPIAKRKKEIQIQDKEVLSILRTGFQEMRLFYLELNMT